MRGTVNNQEVSKPVIYQLNNSMNRVNNLSPLDDIFSKPTEPSYQDDTTESRSYYHGMSVTALNPPSSVSLNHSDTDENNTHIVNTLNEYGIAALTQTAPYDFNSVDLPLMPELTFDEYALYKPDTGYSDDPLLSMSSDHPCNPSRFSGNKPDNSEPTPTNLLNPEYHLINLSAELTNPQDSRPVAGINQPNQEQAASDNPANAAEIVDDKSSQAEQKKARHRRLQRERQRELRKNPVYLARIKERRREFSKNPAYLARERERKRNRRKDPILGEHMRKLQREYQMKRRKHPIQGEALRTYQRNRLRKRCLDDPVFAEGERIYKRTYSSMTKKFSKKEASELASVARQQYLQSMRSPEDSGDISQTSHPAETIRDSNKNS